MRLAELFFLTEKDKMKHLAIGPGGLGYFALLGAANRLHDDGHLKDVETLSGASAGALVVMMIAVNNFNFQDIIHKSLTVPLSAFKINIKCLFESYGLVPRETVRELVSTQIPDLTFQQLYEIFPYKVHVAGYCVELSKTFYFSVDTNPEMSIIDATCISISVPILFSSYKFGPWTYFDGGAIESVPCGHLIGKDSVLAIQLTYKNTYYDDLSLPKYLIMILNGIFSLRKTYTIPTLQIYIEDFNIANFNASNTEKLQIFVEGYNKAEFILT